MSKFNIQTAPGSNIQTQGPVADLQERTPQAEPSGSFEDLLVPAQPQAEGFAAEVQAEYPEGPVIEADLGPEPLTPQQEVEVAQQREREVVTPIHQRREEQRVDQWRSVPAKDIATPDGGISERSKALVSAVQHPEVADRIAVGGTAVTPLFEKLGPARQDPAFYQTLSYVTENFIADLAKDGDVVAPEALTADEEAAAGFTPRKQEGGITNVSKAQGNANLGKQIYRDYQRLKNAQEGRPTDDYQDIPNEDAVLLGDMAKELYYEANKDQMSRQKADDGQVYFIPSARLLDDFAKGAQFRKRLFPKQHVRPAKTATPKGELVGEGKQSVKALTGKVGSSPVNEKVIKQAGENLNKVANVVDKRRLRVLLSTALPALMHKASEVGTNPLLDAYAEINNFGEGKVKKFKAQQIINEKKGKLDYSWQQNLADIKRDIAQSILGIAKERHGANHLTYGRQAFNGRLSPQQTHFDPTTSKAVRFVTRNAIPAMVRPGSRQERNLIQMYSLIIADKGTDALLPEGRVQAMAAQTPKLAAWGKRLQEVLDNSMTDEQAEAIAQAIEDGVALTDQNFPQFNPLGLDPQADADLLTAIKKKGEDGPAFIDGLIDFYNYTQWKKDNKDPSVPGRPFATYFNAYIDGKTNGIASNGMQMGSEKVALRTGVLRSQDSAHAVDNDIDIRDQLMADLTSDIKVNGFDGALKDEYPELYTIAEAVAQHRDLAKKTTMTFGYGKDIDSFANDINDTAYEIAQDNPEVALALENITIDWVTPILSKYATALEAALDAEAIESRHMMWGTAVMNSLANELMTMRSYTGMELRFGNTVNSGEKEALIYDVYGADSKKGRQVGARQYETRATSAAPRTRTDAEGNVSTDIGGWAWGGSVPGPVQSLDAATVAMTVTGKSWERLKQASHGAPYIHSIYDAFKMDANGYDVILKEVNENWKKATLQWSYLKEARDSFDSAEKAFNEKLEGRSVNEEVNLQEEFPFIYGLLDPTGSQSGKFPSNLYRKMKALLPHPKGATPDEKHQRAIDETLDMMKALKVKTEAGKPIETLTVGQIKMFKQQLFGRTRIKRRLDSLIETTDKNKKALASKLKGVDTYQYYTH